MRIVLSRYQGVALHSISLAGTVREPVFAERRKAAGDGRPVPIRIIEAKLDPAHAQWTWR